MRNVIFVLIVLILFSCKKKEEPLPDNHYRIQGKVTGMDNGEIYLSNYPDIDTVVVKEGKFKIENEIKKPVSQIAIVKDPDVQGMDLNNYLNMYIEPSVMLLDLDYNNLQESNLTGSST